MKGELKMKQTKRTKSILALALTLFMVVSVLSAISPAFAATNDNVTLSMVASQPINLTYPTIMPIGSTFTVQVNIANVQGLYGDVFDLSWPSAIVHVTSISEGPFLKSAGGSTLNPATSISNSNPTGSLPSQFNDVLLDSNVASGSGTLATVTFQVVGFGSGSISLTSARLVSDSSGTNIPVVTQIPTSIPLNNPTPPPYGPTAAFTISGNPATVSGNYITIPNTATSTSIILDASTSTPGFTGSVAAPITAYSWKVNGQTVGTTQTVTLTNIAAGDIAVDLTVTATGATPTTNEITTTYHVLQAASTGIDLSTQQGGVGAGVPSGPFGPQQQINATANVYSNGAPVAQKDVIFAVYTNNGAQYAYEVARTNSNGIATVSFRLPTPDTQLDSAFGGNWTIVATVDISQQQYTDSAKFMFNYLANVAGVSVAPGTVVRGHGNQIQISASITNITAVSANAIVAFTVVDSNNVPIAATTASFSNSPSTTLTIPNYAFTGQAKVYVNILSNQPTLSGTPYCPQNGALVTFDSNGLFASSVQNQPAQFIISYQP
jgi:hypothetical protein